MDFTDRPVFLRGEFFLVAEALTLSTGKPLVLLFLERERFGGH